ncbi:MAG TPA: hypothetical protein VGR26_06690 [Acidimicrobiales bacterium]|nr:hypothetical protein [Acidimicrobiales bacterium]
MDVYCTSRTVGGTNRGRQLAAAATLLIAAGACAVTTAVGWPLYQTLLVLGAVTTLAWLIDGSSQRIMGPALTALAVGGGITLYRAMDMDVGKGEHGIVYPMIGAALLLASLFNPLAIRGAGTFLLVVGAVATFNTPWNPGWTLVVALISWGLWEFVRIARTGADEEPQPAATDTENVRTPVGASR